jgi:WD40 repeat protein
LWDVTTGENTATLQAGPKFLLAFSADGQTLLSGSDDRTVRVWDVHSGKQRAILEGHSDQVSCVAISPDGTIAATGGADKAVKLWDLFTGCERSTFRGHTGRVNSLAFGSDGKTLASGSGGMDFKSGKLIPGEVRLWDIDTGQQLCASLRGHTNLILRLAFSPDGAMLAQLPQLRL